MRRMTGGTTTRVMGIVLLPIVALSWSCEERTYRINMREQSGAPSRTFLDSAPSADDLRELSESYGHQPMRDAPSGDYRFQAEFESDLPREFGGHNGWSRLEGELGHTTMWYEIAAPNPDAWPRLMQRVESGILWLRILKRWTKIQFGEENAEAIETVFEEQVIPGVIDGYLRFVGAGSIIASQRVGLRLRAGDERDRLSGDEFFRLEVLVPIILALSAEAPIEPGELHLGFILGMDGSAMPEEYRRAWRRSGEKVALRFLQQFDPDRTEVSIDEIRGWGISIMFFMLQTNRYKDLMLASPAVSEEDKETLRSGGSVLPPAPFGVGLFQANQPSRATFELEPSAPPFLTNGIVMEPEERDESASVEATERITFEMTIPRSQEASLFGTPPAYAFWSTPERERQCALFGEIRLRGLDLGVITGWEALLSERDRADWQAAVLSGVQERSTAPILAFLDQVAGPVPEALRLASEKPRTVAGEQGSLEGDPPMRRHEEVLQRGSPEKAKVGLDVDA